MSDPAPPPSPGHAGQAAAPKSDYKPADISPQRRVQRSYTVRLWSVRHSRALEWFYSRFAKFFLLLHPLWKSLGYSRVEAPVKFVEKRVKGFMFDCRMCGQCILSSTGMSCPMNCPSSCATALAAGCAPTAIARSSRICPASGSRPGKARETWSNGDAILAVQKPVDQSLRETSAWLRVTAERLLREKSATKGA